MNPWDVLTGAGYALDTPRRLLYQGGDALARGLGYTGKPIEHFADVLGHAGMDENSMLTKALGFAGDVATDPLTYAGGFLGKKLGQMAFNRLGPLHGSDAAKLTGLAVPQAEAAHGGTDLIRSVTKAAGQQDAAGQAARQVLNEIPTGSTYLGSGAEALAMKTPQGDVLRIGTHSPKSAVGIPAVDDILQPSRRVAHGGFEVTRAPMATNVGEAPFSEAAEMAKRLHGQGVDFIDIQSGNIGKVGGRNRIIDYGAFDAPHLPFANVPGTATPRFLYGGMAGGAASPATARLMSYLGMRQPEMNADEGL